MPTIQVRVYRPVLNLRPGSAVYITDSDVVRKMIELGHLEEIVPPGSEPDAPPEETP